VTDEDGEGDKRAKEDKVEAQRQEGEVAIAEGEFEGQDRIDARNIKPDALAEQEDAQGEEEVVDVADNEGFPARLGGECG
jgi:hypothetical protein